MEPARSTASDVLAACQLWHLAIDIWVLVSGFGPDTPAPIPPIADTQIDRDQLDTVTISSQGAHFVRVRQCLGMHRHSG
jgi:hypothetical protein